MRLKMKLIKIPLDGGFLDISSLDLSQHYTKVPDSWKNTGIFH
jgi:hypothetical protein